MQLFYNLEVMRYTLYCGEPVHVGFCRSWPGRRFWIPFYAVLEFSSIWPFMASNAAVPLAAAMLGHLPGAGMTNWLGFDMSEAGLVKVLGYLIFILAFAPLIFGGTVYRLIERLMTAKMVIVLAFLTFTSLFMVSGRNVGEVFSGFFQVGSAPLRAATVIADAHFTLTTREAGAAHTIRGTLENGRPVALSFAVDREGTVQTYGVGDPVPAGLENRRRRMLEQAGRLARKGGFYIEVVEGPAVLSAQGSVAGDRSWRPTAFFVKRNGLVERFESLEELPPAFACRLGELVDRQGLELVSLVGYAREHGRLPYLEWAMLAGLAAIAGAGGLSNSSSPTIPGTRAGAWGPGSGPSPAPWEE